ncbi:hypothetical protein L3Q72_13035 [Vibrio sp. JC009]|uniref:DUF6701 domain-containing protein n=1 Tax=Vibrio sp. JC009 TaxID=2912314 RepID=UPI0023B0EE3A|nr:DUF6701 domain-containing protein [Vibrio sp. JC009]WED21538.1 hypothetical protein L3Q72_13035 [Vibrio sp. JC009]
MIKKLVILLSLIYSSFSFSAASPEGVLGCQNLNMNSAFTISFSVDGPSDDQYLYLYRRTGLFSTESEFIWAGFDDYWRRFYFTNYYIDYLFNDTSLTDESYNIKITHTSDGVLTYYIQTSSDSTWLEKEVKTSTESSSGFSLYYNNISNVQCEDSVQSPTGDEPGSSQGFAFSESMCPATAVQSWENSGTSTLNIKNGAKIYDAADGYKIGFEDISGKDIQRNRCRLTGSGTKYTCQPRGEYILGFDVDSISVPDSADFDYGTYKEISGTETFSAGVHKVDGEFKVTGTLNINGDVTLYVTKFTLDGGNVRYQTEGSHLIVINTGSDTSELKDGTAYGHFISRELTKVLDGMKLYGTVTAKDLEVDDANVYFQEPDCTTSPVTGDNYSVAITPSQQYLLQCETSPQVTIDVTDEDGSSAPSGVKVNVSFSPSGIGTAGEYSTDSNGQVVLDLSLSAALDDYSITATLVDDTDESDSATVSVVPYKFDIPEADGIAGKEEIFSMRVLACKDDTATLVEEYSGSKTLSVTTSIEVPASGATDGNFQVKSDTNSTWSSSQITLEFTNGEVDSDASSPDEIAYLRYYESGTVNLTISDSNFDCPEGYSSCVTSNGQSIFWDGLTGSVDVDFRPWTFAICDSENSDMDGNITDASSLGYKAAGEQFDLHIYPIIWQQSAAESDPENDDIDVSGYCDTDNVTHNFYISPSATVTLDHEVAQPSSGENGTLSGTKSFAHSAKSSEGDYYLSELEWSEVGVLRVKVDAGTYLGMDINQGYREIGRFYPNHLALVTSGGADTWTYKDGHAGFAYMGQSIEHNFFVQAMTRDDSPVANYLYFDSDLVADLEYYAMSGTTSLTDRLLDGTDSVVDETSTSWTAGSDWTLIDDSPDYAQLQVNYSEFTFVKNAVASSPYETEADGPYNSGFGVQIITDSGGNTPDGISFNSDRTGSAALSALFSEQPDFRYGRMALTDVGGNSDAQISVPLKVEYWDGNEFVTNTDDSGSAFNSGYYCRQIIWSDSASSDAGFTVTTEDPAQDEMKAYSGEFDNLVATHSGDDREQIRLWLRQQSTEPTSGFDCYNLSGTVDQPWLRYNWRDLGDEDPSVVVVFGTYRGNDRVIFRGESRLTGQ